MVVDLENQKYKMSFTTGGLFVLESVEFARIHENGEDWDVTLDRALAQGLSLLPKATSNRRTFREIKHRVSQLTQEERSYLIDEADRYDQAALIWLGACRAYRFVREFSLEVLQERYLSWRLDIDHLEFDVFFDRKADWDEDLARISEMTRLKLRQILFRMMREAGVVSDAGRILKPVLSSPLVAMIDSNKPADLNVFPGYSAEIR